MPNAASGVTAPRHSVRRDSWLTLLVASMMRERLTKAGLLRRLQGLTSWPRPHRRHYHYSITIHNSLSGCKEALSREPGSNRPLSWYMCGPTVYDHAHLGHARTYVCFDIIRRILDRFGVPSTVAMGLTDVDDKIIARAHASKVPPLELARNFEQSFYDDMKVLGVWEPNFCLRVSEHIDEIKKFVSKLIEQGFAYELNGDVWFDTKRFHNTPRHSYGKLPGAGFDEAAINQEDDKKPRRTDFALWKSAKPGDDIYWMSPWGAGRPGWHIECSAMSTSVFGNTLDLHSGGIDLKFPHHNNEIAQCEAHYGGPWVKQFIHSGHLKIDGLKMSKSLKNFITVKDLLKTHTADEYRMFCLMHHYSSSVTFSEDRMMDARNVIETISNFLHTARHLLDTEQMLRFCRMSEADLHLQQYFVESRITMNKLLAEDFNTSDFLTVFLDLISATNRLIRSTRVSRTLVCNLLQYVEEFLSQLGFRCFAQNQASQHPDTNTLNLSLKSLVQFRSEVRSSARSLLRSESAPVGQRLLKSCDDLRDGELKEAGINLRDLPDGSTTFKVVRVFASSAEKHPVPPPPCNPRRNPLTYSKFDAKGVPTHDSDGNKVSVRERKRFCRKRDSMARKIQAAVAKEEAAKEEAAKREAAKEKENS